MTDPARLPGATYRIQLSPECRLDDAARLVPYLAALGVSHVYLSPHLSSAPGTSGYGVVDPGGVDPALGGEAGRQVLLVALRDAGLGQVVDIVPNHMAADPANPWWQDVVSRGRQSPYAGHFDIWWDEGSPGHPRHRRFFDIGSLVGVRQEEPEVFADTHSLVLGWAAAGDVDGLRVDHPDGLRDPQAYFERLSVAAPGAWMVAEKILSRGEQLRESWPVAGTTGYDFMNLALRVLVDPAGEEPLTRLWQAVSGSGEPFAEVAYRAKGHVLGHILADEVDHIVRLAGGDRPEALREAVREYLSCLPVYRTYLRPPEPPSPEDSAVIEQAVAGARRRRPDLDPALFEMVHDPAVAPALQQVSGAVTAKSVEDTAFYRYNRLVALNEVGGDPAEFAVSPDRFHAWCQEMAERWPERMNSTATHDTKRGEDLRARLAVLTEMPADWARCVTGWLERDPDFPDRSLQYLLYQVMVGAHPLEEDRAQAYMQKAAREAKQSTSWIQPDSNFEAELRRLVSRCLSLAADFACKIVPAGRLNSLSLKLLCLTAPGVPDVYQGAELWDLSLVDPDNRRPVDHALRSRMLERLSQAGPVPGEAEMAAGLPKLHLVSRTLRLRRERPDLYGPRAAYEPLPARGEKSSHLIAFIRGGGAVTLAPRLPLGLRGEWGGTEVVLPPGRWRDRLTGLEVEGGRQSVRNLLAAWPVGLLVREAARP